MANSLDARPTWRMTGGFRGGTFAACALYIAAFTVSYRLVASTFFKFEGFVIQPRSPFAWVMALGTALVPALFPPVTKRPSLALYWLLYVLMYVPGVLVPFFSLKEESSQ